MWEKGQSYTTEPGRDKIPRLLEYLESFGFTQYRFPSSDFSGPLIPFAPTPELGNVFALSEGFQKKPLYELPFEPRPPFNPLFSTPADPQIRAKTTELLISVRSSDGARWANPKELELGAEERAKAAAAFIPPGSRVLDLVAGAMILANYLAPGCEYTPADIIARCANCLVVDLNQQQFSDGHFDVITLLETLEYMHDPSSLLLRCRHTAARLIFTYHIFHDESRESRRQQGWFNDLELGAITSMLSVSGWRIMQKSPLCDTMLFVCHLEGS
jgi:hypothetical protein